MPALLISILVWFLGNAVARVLLGAGMSIVSVVWIEDVLNDMLSDLAGMLATGLPEIVGVIGNGGIWIALGNLGSAMLMRVAILGAANVMGLRRIK